MGRTDSQYRAFISYSHADRRTVDWLHGALEGYRIPSKLVGELTPLGPVPARLGQLFRDRDELPAAGDLSAELKAALKRSMFLIVVCSPAAAQSKWVNEEVRQFKLLHGHKRGDGTARVLALIADGDPADPGGAACFPPALRYHVLPDGSISDDPAEPIAADIRPGGDGKKLAKLKLVAGLTGLPLDALVQREAARRQRRAAILSGASLALVAVMAVLTVLAVQGRREAERQRAQADGLIEYMLTDLREKLEPVGRLEVMDSVGQRALAYYAAQDLGGLDPDALGRRARALHLVGEVRDLRGDGEGALTAFREAERTTGELLARDPQNPDRMFDHAQSVFWVGQVAWARKDWAAAEARFRRYVELADGMVAQAPGDPRGTQEQGYAASALGALFLETDRPSEAVTQFERYVSVAGKAVAAAPDDPVLQRTYGQSLAWLSDAQARSGQLSAAKMSRTGELRAYGLILARDPLDRETGAMLGRAQEALAELLMFEGDISGAAQRAKVARETLSALVEADPDNLLYQEYAARAAMIHAEALALQSDWAGAASANAWALESARRLVAEDSRNTSRRTSGLLHSLWLDAVILGGSGRRQEAAAALRRVEADLGAERAADVAANAGQNWVVLLSLSAAQRLATDDMAGAQQWAREARTSARRAPSAREAAVLSALQRRLDRRADRTSGPNGYPADRLLDAIAGP